MIMDKVEKLFTGSVDQWGDLVPLTGPVPMDDPADVDPVNVAQKGAGDCWLVSSIIAILDQPWGATQLRSHLLWDEARKGYVVTLYEGGKARHVFVDQVHSNFTRVHGVIPSWVSVFEEAVYRLENDKAGKVNGRLPTAGFDYLLGGSKPVAASFLGGSGPKVSERKARLHLLWDSNADDADRYLDQGKIVLAASNPGGFWGKFFGSTGEIEAETRGADGVWTPKQVTIAPSHVYVVVDVDDDDRVSLMNPWGEGNSNDGGGVFRISGKHFNDNFGALSTIDPTPPPPTRRAIPQRRK